MTDASSMIDARRLNVGGLLIKNISRGLRCALITRSSIPCYRSVVISVSVTRQRRHLERVQCV